MDKNNAAADVWTKMELTVWTVKCWGSDVWGNFGKYWYRDTRTGHVVSLFRIK
jgi:hypothetical protein